MTWVQQVSGATLACRAPYLVRFFFWGGGGYVPLTRTRTHHILHSHPLTTTARLPTPSTSAALWMRRSKACICGQPCYATYRIGHRAYTTGHRAYTIGHRAWGDAPATLPWCPGGSCQYMLATTVCRSHTPKEHPSARHHISTPAKHQHASTPARQQSVSTPSVHE